ncbi:MAG: potassium transporter TrkG, partial [Cyclobacteriaceae bacterium]
KDITNTEKVGEVLSTLKRIVVITVIVEAIAFILIFLSLGSNYFNDSLSERLYFSVFHSISAFCNAGFSTLSASIYEGPFRFAYTFQVIVTVTFIIGGLGFPIVNNIIQLVHYKLVRLFQKKQKERRPWVLGVNTKLILITTFILLLAGTLAVLIFEYDNTLSEHDLGGKIVTAFFAGATPRTAGFNNVNMSGLHTGTILITLFLMWVGASPGSTGGGIKTTTFSIASLNFLSMAQGKDRIEIFHREVSSVSVRRAFATITLSIVILSLAIFAVRIFDPALSLTDIVFECFSAFSTVGLSLGITAELSMASKIMITLIMFIGRVGALTLLIAFMRKKKLYNYKYPSENILIN